MADQRLQSRQSFLEEAETFLQKGDARAALDRAGLRLEQLPDDPDARIVICRAHILEGRPEEAGEMLRGMEELLTNLARIYRELGDLFLEKGVPESARIYYSKFISLNPDAPAALEIAERIRNIPEARGTDDGAGPGEEEATEVPEDFRTVTLAELYIRQGHLQAAKEVLEAILRKDPQQEGAANRLREVMERLSAEEAAAKAAPVIDELSRWLDNIGRLRGDAA